MALWLVRAGSGCEYETRYFTDNKIYLTWAELNTDPSRAQDYEGIKAFMRQAYPDIGNQQLGNGSGQAWVLPALQMQPGDWVVTPLRPPPRLGPRRPPRHRRRLAQDRHRLGYCGARCRAVKLRFEVCNSMDAGEYTTCWRAHPSTATHAARVTRRPGGA